MSCGGLSGSKPADNSIRNICDQVKGDVEKKAGKSFSKFEAKHYASQIVAGTNYFIKVDVGDSFVHIRVYQTLPHAGSTLEVHGVKVDMKEADPIVYFDQC